jgi:hypothetical protein
MLTNCRCRRELITFGNLSELTIDLSPVQVRVRSGVRIAFGSFAEIGTEIDEVDPSAGGTDGIQ